MIDFTKTTEFNWDEGLSETYQKSIDTYPIDMRVSETNVYETDELILINCIDQ
jgi:hypothetical protein